jgi:chemotaxis signal transduction protein
MKMTKKNNLDNSEIHLIFRLGKSLYGVPVSKACNIFEISRMTCTNQSSDLILGNINLRGSLIPIVNLHPKFGTKQNDYTFSTSILVLEANSTSKFHVGIIIDALQEVAEIKHSDIETATAKSHAGLNGCIKGYYKNNKQYEIGILEPEKMFTNEEILTIKKSF